MDTELSTTGKFFAGLFLIFFTGLSIVLLVGYWPDRFPDTTEKNAVYRNRLFHVSLVKTTSETKASNKDTLTAPRQNAVANPDTPLQKKLNKNSADTAPATAPVKQPQKKQAAIATDTTEKYGSDGAPRGRGNLGFNTLLLILVALGGVLGNMISISSSFATLVAVRKFDKSWLLWYWVSPLTAAGLSLVFYFVFRAGFLNYSSDAANINVYGMMALALLTGLFTKIAFQKLRSLFGDFDAKFDKTKATDTETTITKISPDKLSMTGENQIVINGTHLDKQMWTITVNNVPIPNPTVTATAISFNYKIPDDQAALTEFKFKIHNPDNTYSIEKTFSV